MKVHSTGDIDWNNDFRDMIHKPCHLYIKQRVSSIKEEVLEYKYLSVKEYKHKIIPKANNYHHTNYAKSIKAKGEVRFYCEYVPPHYGITPGTVITLSHIVSVILYTDYDRLSADFSSTFRKKDVYSNNNRIN